MMMMSSYTPYGPLGKATLKERIADARTKLGTDKADAILARTLAAEKKQYDREFLTLRRQAETLENAVAEDFARARDLARRPKASPLLAQAAATKPTKPMPTSTQPSSTTSSRQKLTRTEFRKLNDRDRLHFCLKGGVLIDDPPAAPSQKSTESMLKKDWLKLSAFKRGEFQMRGQVVPETKTRSEFQSLSAGDRLAFVKEGGKLIE